MEDILDEVRPELVGHDFGLRVGICWVGDTWLFAKSTADLSHMVCMLEAGRPRTVSEQVASAPFHSVRKYDLGHRHAPSDSSIIMRISHTPGVSDEMSGQVVAARDGAVAGLHAHDASLGRIMLEELVASRHRIGRALPLVGVGLGTWAD